MVAWGRRHGAVRKVGGLLSVVGGPWSVVRGTAYCSLLTAHYIVLAQRRRGAEGNIIS
jgi:hypothetical protein